MGLLDLVQQDDGVGAAADLFGELAAFLVAHVARRRTDQAAHGELLHVLAHVYADQGVLGVEEVAGQFLGQLGLAHAGGAQEDEGADGAVGVLEAGAVALDGLHHLAHGLVLADHLAGHLLLHAAQLAALLLGDAGHGDAAHHGHHLGHVLLVHLHAVAAAFLFPGLLGLLEVLLQLALAVAQLGGLLVALAAHHAVLLVLHLFDLLLDLQDVLGHHDVADVHPAAGLVQGVDGLVRQVAVGDVALGELHAGLHGLGGEVHVVVVLVLLLDVVEDLDGLVHAGGFHEHLLEAALQGPVLLDVLAVLVQGGGADALDLTPRQSGLEHVAGVQRATGAAGAHDGVDLVDEEDHVRAVLQLVHHRLHALLELAAVLGAGHQAGDVQRHDALVEEHAAHLALHDAQGQALGNGALAHAGLADQHGVVLLAAAQHLAHAFDLLLAAHDGVQLALLGHLGQVAAEVVQHGRLALGVALLAGPAATVGGAALVVVIVGAAAGHLGLGTAVSGQDALHFLLHGVVVHVEAAERAGGQVVLVLQHAQQQVLGIDVGALEQLGLEEGDLEHLLGLAHQPDLVLLRGVHGGGGLHAMFHHAAKLVQVHLQAAQDLHGIAFAFPDDAEQDVFDADMVVPQTQRLLTAVSDHVAHTG